MARLVENFDLRGAFNYLVEDPDEGGMGLTRPQAENQIARRLSKETSFDIDSALKEGYNNNQIISKLTGIEPRAGLSVFGEGVVRGAIEETPEALGFAYGVKPGAALAAKLPIPPGPQWPVVKGLTVAAGGLLGGISTMLGMSYLDAASGASEKIGDLVLGEKEDILPEDQPWREAGETTGLFLSFSGALRGPLRRLGKEPDIPISRGVALVGEEKAIDLGARRLLNNIATLNQKPGIGARMLGGIERTLETMGRGAREPGFWRREAILSTRGGIGAGAAEQVDPGDAGSAFFGTLIGLTMPYGLVAAGAVGIWRRAKDFIWGGGAKARKDAAASRQLDGIFKDTNIKMAEREKTLREQAEKQGIPYQETLNFAEIERHNVAALLESFYKSDAFGDLLAPGVTPIDAFEAIPLLAIYAQKMSRDPSFTKNVSEGVQRYTALSYEGLEKALDSGNPDYIAAFADAQEKMLNSVIAEDLQGYMGKIALTVDKGLETGRIEPGVAGNVIMRTFNKEMANGREIERLLWKDKAAGGRIDHELPIIPGGLVKQWDELNKAGELTGRLTAEEAVPGGVIDDILALAGTTTKKANRPFTELKRKYTPNLKKLKSGITESMASRIKDDLTKLKIDLTPDQFEHLQMFIAGTQDRLKIFADDEHIFPRAGSFGLGLMQDSYFAGNFAVNRGRIEGSSWNHARVAQNARDEIARFRNLERTGQLRIEDIVAAYIKPGNPSWELTTDGSAATIRPIADGLKRSPGITMNTPERFESLLKEENKHIIGSYERIAKRHEKLAKQYPEKKYSQQALLNSFTDALPLEPQAISLGQMIALRSALGKKMADPSLEPQHKHVIGQLLDGGNTGVPGGIEADLMAFAAKEENTSTAAALIEAINYSRAFNEVFTKSLGGKDIRSQVVHSDLDVKRGDLLMGKLLGGSKPETVGKAIEDLIQGATFVESQWIPLARIASSSNNPAEKELWELINEFVPHLKGTLDISKKVGYGNPSKKTIEENIVGVLRDMAAKGVVELSVGAPGVIPPAVFKGVGREPSKEMLSLAEEVIPTINRRKLDGYIEKWGVFAKTNPFIEPLIRDLQHIETAQNALNLFKEKGYLHKIRVDKQQLASVSGYDSPVYMIEKGLKGDKPVEVLKNQMRVVNRMKDSSVKVRNFETGEIVPAKEVYESARQGLLSSHLTFALTEARDPNVPSIFDPLDASGREYPYTDANKLYDYFFETGNVIPTMVGKPSIMDTLIEGKIAPPDEGALYKEVLGKIATVQSRLNFAVETGKSLRTEYGSKGLFTRMVARMFGAQAGGRLGRFFGVGTIQIPAFAASYAEQFFINAPAAATVALLDDMLHPGNHEKFIKFLKDSPKEGEKADSEVRAWIQEAFPAPIGKSPFLAGAVSDYLTEESPREVIPPPPPPIPTTNIGMSPSSPAVSGMQQNVGQQPVTNQRARYAAMFPFDPASEVVRERQAQGIGSLAVP